MLPAALPSMIQRRDPHAVLDHRCHDRPDQTELLRPVVTGITAAPREADAAGLHRATGNVAVPSHDVWMRGGL